MTSKWALGCFTVVSANTPGKPEGLLIIVASKGHHSQQDPDICIRSTAFGIELADSSSLTHHTHTPHSFPDSVFTSVNAVSGLAQLFSYEIRQS